MTDLRQKMEYLANVASRLVGRKYVMRELYRYKKDDIDNVGITNYPRENESIESSGDSFNKAVENLYDHVVDMEMLMTFQKREETSDE